VAAIVAVLKFLLPTAYSLIFFIPLLEKRPNIKFITKNPIKIAVSILKCIIKTKNLFQFYNINRKNRISKVSAIKGNYNYHEKETTLSSFVEHGNLRTPPLAKVT
jgi:hypothetical protein